MSYTEAQNILTMVLSCVSIVMIAKSVQKKNWKRVALVIVLMTLLMITLSFALAMFYPNALQQ